VSARYFKTGVILSEVPKGNTPQKLGRYTVKRSSFVWMMMKNRCTKPSLILGLLVSLAGCHRDYPRPQISAPIARDTGYLDLQPGWRLRVVTPILRSGGYQVKTVEKTSADGTIILNVEQGFLGYQTDFYSVSSPAKGHTIISFRRGEFTSTDQVKTSKASPAVKLFNLDGDTRYVRLLFLTRVSDAEHDEAVLAAASQMALDALTAEVETNPVANCKSQPEGDCSWVPVRSRRAG
jgi:hypothetical protein